MIKKKIKAPLPGEFFTIFPKSLVLKHSECFSYNKKPQIKCSGREILAVFFLVLQEKGWTQWIYGAASLKQIKYNFHRACS